MKMEKKVQYGEIYYYDFGERSGSCQRGLHPALVIQEDIPLRATQVIVAELRHIRSEVRLFTDTTVYRHIKKDGCSFE